jgi:signal transduction histidine kinase
MITNTFSKCGLRPLSIFRGIVFISLLAIVSLPLYIFFFVSPSLVDYISTLKEEEAVDLAIHMESKLIPDKSQELTRSILTTAVIKRLKETCRDFDLLKARILLPDGEILFSTDENEVGGNVNPDSRGLKHLSSTIYTKFIEKGSLDLDGDISSCDTVETYVPIMRDETFIGGFEIYRDVTADRERLGSLLQLFNFALFPIVLILFSSVILSCRKANNFLTKRIEAETSLCLKSLELEQKNWELTSLVAQCRNRQLKLEEEQKARLAAQDQVKKELVKRERLRVEFLRHTVQAQEEERARIARELHDETAQTLTAASLNFCVLGKMLEGNDEVGDVVDRLQELCRQMNQDLYRLVHDLRPAQLDDLGLVAALRHLTDEGQRGTGVQVAFEVIDSAKRLDSFVETIIFRVVQEALTNVIRHAETDKALVELDFSSKEIVTLRVSDKGKGFEDGDIQLTKPGWGLVGMAERVESINGVLTIDSASGKGTTVEVVIECSN